MKENPKSAWDTNVTILWKRILKVHEMLTYHSILRETYKCARYKGNNLMKENPKSARDSNVTVHWKRILKEFSIQLIIPKLPYQSIWKVIQHASFHFVTERPNRFETIHFSNLKQTKLDINCNLWNYIFLIKLNRHRHQHFTVNRQKL